LGEGVPGTRRRGFTESSQVVGEAAETSESGAQENNRDQEARALLWSSADIPSFEASILPECVAGDGATDVAGRVFDGSLPEEAFLEHKPTSVF